MNTPHTPGPWKAYPEDLISWVRGANGESVATCGMHHRDENSQERSAATQHDVILIAAAPDLLKACRQAVSDLTSAEPLLVKVYNRVVHNLRKAIAAAEGRTP